MKSPTALTLALAAVALALLPNAATAQRSQQTKPGGVENAPQVGGSGPPASMKLPPQGRPGAPASGALESVAPKSPPAAVRPPVKDSTKQAPTTGQR